VINCFRLGTAQYPIDRHNRWQDYQSKIHNWIQQGTDNGAQMLVFPEYASMELISLTPGFASMDLTGQIQALQQWAAPYFDLHCQLAKQYGVYILAGSFPLFKSGSFLNTAWFFTPDGQAMVQEKLIMTRFEREEWCISPGSTSNVIDCALGRIGIAICYDSEFPLLVRKQVEAGAQIILVPSCTDTLAGYWRVRIACQARALENQCYVVQSPTIGTADWSLAVDINIGAAGIFGPPDRGFPDTGIVALGTMNQPGWIYGDIDLSALADARNHGQVFNHRHWQEQHEIGPINLVSLNAK